jgi:serine/threonine-protein kinase RsbW
VAASAGVGESRARDLQLVVPARAENVAVVRHAVAGLAEAVHMEPAQVSDLKTVVTEACMNVVVHAYDEGPGPIEVDAYRDGEELVVEVRDRGAGIRPRADVERGSLRMGLPLIAALSTSFEISGGPNRGTTVTMRMGLVVASGEPPKGATAEKAEDGAAMAMPAGDLVGPVLSRVISIFAVRANFSVDRLSDAVLLGDAISAQAAEHFPEGTTNVVVDEEGGTLAVRVGPLVDGAGDRLLGRMRIPEINASLEGLADAVSIDRDDGEEHLVLEIARQGE